MKVYEYIPYSVSPCMHLCSLFSVFLSTLDLKAFDVKALRAFRVLRPLKLVSGVPSTYSHYRYYGLFILLVYNDPIYPQTNLFVALLPASYTEYDVPPTIHYECGSLNV